MGKCLACGPRWSVDDSAHAAAYLFASRGAILAACRLAEFLESADRENSETSVKHEPVLRTALFFFSVDHRKRYWAPWLERGHAGLLRSWRGTTVHRDPHSGALLQTRGRRGGRGVNTFLHLAGVQARGTESRSSCQCEAGSALKVSGGAFSAEAEGSNPSGGSPHHKQAANRERRAISPETKGQPAALR